jgi:hypothetical protein
VLFCDQTPVRGQLQVGGDFVRRACRPRGLEVDDHQSVAAFVDLGSFNFESVDAPTELYGLPRHGEGGAKLLLGGDDGAISDVGMPVQKPL